VLPKRFQCRWALNVSGSCCEDAHGDIPGWVFVRKWLIVSFVILPVRRKLIFRRGAPVLNRAAERSACFLL
jgi:hypothetical protein